MKSRLGERGQITIPKPIRDRLGMRRGQLLEIREERGEVVLTKSVVRDPVDDVYGTLHTGLTTDEMIEQMRGSAELPPEPSSD
jgi:AbrB family looped-hinge helix DNA binding protein